MRRFAFLLFSVCCALGLQETVAARPAAADTLKKDSINVWVPTMVTGINVSQIAFSNWTQGGSNALAWTVTANLGYDYRGEIWGLQNHLKAAYGSTKLGSQGTITTDNTLFLENVLTCKVGWIVRPYFSNAVITTITAGYSYGGPQPVLIADFFDPGYVTQSLGFSYNKLSDLSTRLGVATQEVFANKYRQYTDDPNTTDKVEAFKLEIGLESVTQAKLQIADNILLTTGLTLFTRFNSLEVWDVRWDNMIAAKVNSFINVNFNYLLVYQKDQSLTTQMKEGLQLGLVYTIF
ncbi:MAG TPA: DUF3078 domain-containing protein [Candidatus Kryptonia bacterium]